MSDFVSPLLITGVIERESSPANNTPPPQSKPAANPPSVDSESIDDLFADESEMQAAAAAAKERLQEQENRRFVPETEMVDEMTYQDESAAQQPESPAEVKESGKVSANFVSGLLFNVAPAAAHQAVKISEKELRKAVRDGKPAQDLLNKVKAHNDNTADDLKPAAYVRELVEPALEEFLVAHNYQIPAHWQLGIGLVVYLIDMGIKVMAIQRSNETLQVEIKTALTALSA